ncbi:MAG: GDP-mannose 4,6-dehydratase [Pseudomonas sp.]|uniref:GDP-mannose 4,6-dehydratase n=1 Tax=Pseudomonas sp. TaxID=306 RepID=UPI00339B1F6F
MKQLLVTGLSGFVGGHVQGALASDQQSEWSLWPAAAFDLLDTDSLDRLFSRGCPDAVIHLAGQTFVPEAFRDPRRTLEVNLLGTLNLLQALKRHGFNGSFLYVSSGDVYGKVEEADLPVRETLLPQPRNPYAVSKVSAELLCQQWSYAESWRIIVARPFNHIGPGQNDSFVIANMARQIVRVRKGLQAPQLDVGDVDVTRDFLDVRDVVQAYLQLLQRGKSGSVYNLCSGQERRIRDLIEEMAALAGVEIQLQQDATRLRLSEQRRVVGSADKLQKETGWKPSITITESLRSVLCDWELRETQE